MITRNETTEFFDGLWAADLHTCGFPTQITMIITNPRQDVALLVANFLGIDDQVRLIWSDKAIGSGKVDQIDLIISGDHFSDFLQIPAPWFVFEAYWAWDELPANVVQIIVQTPKHHSVVWADHTQVIC